MTHKYDVEVLAFSNLTEIEGFWKPTDYAALLDAMEFGDHAQMGPDELREMCLMSLQDQEPDDAAYLVLKHVIGDELKDSQLRAMSHEMASEKLWEEYVDPAFHERLFSVGSLLFAAMPQTFPKTDAVKLKLQVTAADKEALQSITPAPAEALLVRLLADGMDDNAVLHRLYGDQLAGTSFPNAEEVVWIVQAELAGDLAATIEIIGSGYWLDALERTRSYETDAYADSIQTSDA